MRVFLSGKIHTYLLLLSAFVCEMSLCSSGSIPINDSNEFKRGSSNAFIQMQLQRMSRHQKEAYYNKETQSPNAYKCHTSPMASCFIFRFSVGPGRGSPCCHRLLVGPNAALLRRPRRGRRRGACGEGGVGPAWAAGHPLRRVHSHGLWGPLRSTSPSRRPNAKV